MAEVVVLRALNLGDLLVAVPALRAIRRHWPRHQLVLATSSWLAPVVNLVGDVDELLPTEGLAPIRRRDPRPRVAINLHGSGPHSNAVLDGLRPVRRIGHAGTGWPGPAWQAELPERWRWCRLLIAHGIPAEPADLLLRRPWQPSPAPAATVLHAGAGRRSRHWPVRRFATVAAELARCGHRVVVTGNAAELNRAAAVAALAKLPAAVVFAGRTSLAELTALIAQARLLISADTGVAHLSYAYRTPSVVLFGPASPSRWGPPAGPHIALTRSDLRRGDELAATPDPALLGISATAVLDAAAELLQWAAVSQQRGVSRPTVG